MKYRELKRKLRKIFIAKEHKMKLTNLKKLNVQMDFWRLWAQTPHVVSENPA
jgi:hypothetical protein